MLSADAPSADHPAVFAGLSLVAGHPALDFLNTIKFRGQANDGERLLGFGDIVNWARIAGLLDESEYAILLRTDDDNPEIRRLHRETVAFREEARILIGSGTHDSTRRDRATRYVERAISQLRPKIVISRETGSLERRFPILKPRDLKHRIVACFEAFLQERPHLSVKTCKGHDCDWVFIDRTKAKRRLWCDTRTCGNAARVRRYRAATRVRGGDGSV